MKTFSILFMFSMLAACNDAPRNRLSNCKNEYGKMIACSTSNALMAGETVYRKQYIAQATVPVSVGQNALTFNDSEYNEDYDQDYNCNLDVARGTKFNYSITNNKLTLKNSLATLVLVKTDRLSEDGLLGAWQMQSAETTKVDAVTEMVFMDHDEVRIKKVCNLKK
jgi:hypothetical protein